MRTAWLPVIESLLANLILILFTVEAKTANHIIQFDQFYHLFLHHEQRPVWIISPLLLIHYPSISAKNQFTDWCVWPPTDREGGV